MPFDVAVNFVLSHEGGYVNDPQDPGGETKYGISKRSYPSLDIAALTREQAIEIYRRDFWERCRCDDLPPAVGLLLFDAAVNQGPNAAIRHLQRALHVAVDGVIGPTTINAARQAGNSAVAEFVAQRSVAYATNPNVARYGLGWFRRLAAAHEAALTSAPIT